MTSTCIGLENRIRDLFLVQSKLCVTEEGSPDVFFSDFGGNILARGYERVLLGDHGPYFEFKKDQIEEHSFTEFHKRKYYDELWSPSGVKLYRQKCSVSDRPNPPPGVYSVHNNRPEGYADYRPGFFYISCDAVYVRILDTPCNCKGCVSAQHGRHVVDFCPLWHTIFGKFRGSVLWFNRKKGMGFIQPDDGGDEIFVHQSALLCKPTHFRQLRQSERVEYELVVNASEKKIRAAKVSGPCGILLEGGYPARVDQDTSKFDKNDWRKVSIKLQRSLKLIGVASALRRVVRRLSCAIGLPHWLKSIQRGSVCCPIQPVNNIIKDENLRNCDDLNVSRDQSISNLFGTIYRAILNSNENTDSTTNSVSNMHIHYRENFIIDSSQFSSFVKKNGYSDSLNKVGNPSSIIQNLYLFEEAAKKNKFKATNGIKKTQNIVILQCKGQNGMCSSKIPENIVDALRSCEFVDKIIYITETSGIWGRGDFPQQVAASHNTMVHDLTSLCVPSPFQNQKVNTEIDKSNSDDLDVLPPKKKQKTDDFKKTLTSKCQHVDSNIEIEIAKSELIGDDAPTNSTTLKGKGIKKRSRKQKKRKLPVGSYYIPRVAYMVDHCIGWASTSAVIVLDRKHIDKNSCSDNPEIDNESSKSRYCWTCGNTEQFHGEKEGKCPLKGLDEKNPASFQK